jgi:hypothetical protein
MLWTLAAQQSAQGLTRPSKLASLMSCLVCSEILRRKFENIERSFVLHCMRRKLDCPLIIDCTYFLTTNEMWWAGNKPTITSKEKFYDKNEDQGPDEWTDTSMDWTRTDTSMDQGPSFRSMTKQDYLSLYGEILFGLPSYVLFGMLF